MGTQVEAADAASQRRGRPCMEVALRLPSYPPHPTHPPPEVKFVCLALFTGDGASRTSSFLCRASLWPLCTCVRSVPPLGGGWRRAVGSESICLAGAAKCTCEEEELHVPLVRLQGAGNRLSVMKAARTACS